MTTLENIQNRLIDKILVTRNVVLLEAIENIFVSTQTDDTLPLSSEQIEMLKMSENDIEVVQVSKNDDYIEFCLIDLMEMKPVKS